MEEFKVKILMFLQSWLPGGWWMIRSLKPDEDSFVAMLRYRCHLRKQLSMENGWTLMFMGLELQWVFIMKFLKPIWNTQEIYKTFYSFKDCYHWDVYSNVWYEKISQSVAHEIAMLV